MLPSKRSEQFCYCYYQVKNAVKINHYHQSVKFCSHSALDLKRLIGWDERLQLLKMLHRLHGIDYTYNIPREILGDNLSKFEVWSITSMSKLECKENPLLQEFRNLWLVISNISPLYVKDGVNASMNSLVSFPVKLWHTLW